MKKQTAAWWQKELREGTLGPCRQELERAFDLLAESFRRGGKVLVCGNGGSAADSEHIVGELMKGFHSRRPIPEADRARLARSAGEEGRYLAERLQGALPAISLVSQVSLSTAVANDVAADLVFAQQVYGYGREGDVLMGISTSGNAANVLHALRTARAFGVGTLGLTGEEGGRMKDLCQVLIRVPVSITPEVQVWHLRVYHTLCALLELEFFGQSESGR
jgi:D-sedoheptulose 7-phosphate isomerase